MRGGWSLSWVVLVALALFVPAGARADEAHPPGGIPQAGEAAKGPAEGHQAEKAKEEQQDIFGWAMDLAIWTILVFLVLLWVLSKFAWGPMLQGLERREQSIRSALDEAQHARDEAARLRDQLQAEMNRASDRVREMLDQARRDGQRVMEEMTAKARAEIQSERDRLHRELETARDQALQQIWNQAGDLATRVSAKVIRRQLNHDDHRRLIDEALAELRQAAAVERHNGEGALQL
jgi:F-type H+-transporting ATPase subunit b